MSTWTDCYDCRISWDDDYGKEYECPLCKAHNRIAELEAEVARLKSERDHWASDAGPDSCVAILKENERLEAEVERLEAEVERLEAEVERLRRVIAGCERCSCRADPTHPERCRCWDDE